MSLSCAHCPHDVIIFIIRAHASYVYIHAHLTDGMDSSAFYKNNVRANRTKRREKNVPFRSGRAEKIEPVAQSSRREIAFISGGRCEYDFREEFLRKATENDVAVNRDTARVLFFGLRVAKYRVCSFYFDFFFLASSVRLRFFFFVVHNI